MNKKPYELERYFDAQIVSYFWLQLNYYKTSGKPEERENARTLAWESALRLTNAEIKQYEELNSKKVG